jgi:regulator of sirC expression with transglutaminase-like and TPR domain
VGELVELLSGRSERVPLDRAALELAALDCPGLDPAPYLAVLDGFAAELAGRIAPRAGGMDFVLAANDYLFHEQRFAGNTADYYDPGNSMLNAVLERRTGLPITLALIYIEVARRLRRPVYGIGLPGHFLVQYNDGLFATFIDPFHAGRLLAAPDCFALARETAGREVPDDLRLLAPFTNRQILLRMTANLRRAWFRRGAYAKELRLLDLLLEALPHSGPEHRERAVVHIQLGNMRLALQDLERYLRFTPDAPDRAEVEKHVQSLKVYLARLN